LTDNAAQQKTLLTDGQIGPLPVDMGEFFEFLLSAMCIFFALPL